MTGARLVALHRYPVKSMGGESLERVDILSSGLRDDRAWAVYGSDGKLGSGKHTRRFRRMDPVFELVARMDGQGARVRFPDGVECVVGEPDADTRLAGHLGEPVRLCREDGIPHQDAGDVSVVGTATLRALGAHEGDGRPLDPRHLRANLVVTTDEPFAEESWVGGEIEVGGAVLRVLEPIERCRMVGIAQVGLPERPGMLKAIADHHGLMAGLYLSVVTPGAVAVGCAVAPLTSPPGDLRPALPAD